MDVVLVWGESKDDKAMIDLWVPNYPKFVPKVNSWIIVNKELLVTYLMLENKKL